MDDLADVVGSALAPKPITTADFPSNGTVPDSVPRAILAGELKQNPNDPNLRREVSLRFPDMQQPAQGNPNAFDPSVVVDALSHPVAAPAASGKPGAVADTYDRLTSFPAGAAQVVANQVTGIGAQIVGGWRGLATLASGGSLEDAAKAVNDTAQEGTYQPAPGSAAAKVTDALVSNRNPMNLPSVIAAKAADATMEATGSPAAATAVKTAINAVPLILIKGGKAPAIEGEKLAGSGSIANERPVAQVTSEPNYDIPTILRRRAEVPVEAAPAAAAGKTAPLTLAPQEATAGRTPSFDGPATVKDAPTPEAAVKEAEVAPKFSEAEPPAPIGQTLPAEEQARRSAVLERIGLPASEQRVSAVQGDGTSAATDYQTSLLDNSAGRFAKAKIDQERAALTAHADSIVADTGGTAGLDAQSVEARGHAILSPLEAFKQWFTDKTNGLYAEARARAGDQPLALNRFQDVLGTDSKFSNTDTIELRKGIQARMRELGMLDKDGNALPATVEQAENLRQYVNEEWSPKSNGRIRELKNALDEDVTSAAGEDIYKQARALHAMKQSIFADPKGLSSILDSEGINRRVPVEKIPDAVASLPNAQFAHIVKTLQSVPPEIAPQAQGALSEIKAQFANRMREAGASRQGQWGARDVSAYLNKNAVKMRLVFSPEEMAKIGDLNDAGHILAKPQGYPGAVVQGHNLLKRGALATLPKAGAMAGGTLGMLFGAPGTGALVGDTVGASLAAKIGEKSALAATQKRFGVKLGDFLK